MRPVATIVIVPGLRAHLADHWQTLLATKLARTRPVRSVPALGREDLSCARRVAAIQETLNDVHGPVILVAHSAGAIMVAHWARHHQRSDIAGALLATPADLDTPLPPGYPSFSALQDNGWLPVPRAKLPFPSIVAASSNDPLAAFERVEQLACDWGSRCHNLGAVGHLNPGSGFGEWPLAEELIGVFDQP